MTLLGTQRGQTLILLATWLFFAGGAASTLVVYDPATKQLEKAIKRVITDEQRKSELLTEVKMWRAVQKSRDGQVSDDQKELIKMLRRQATQQPDLTPVITRLDTQFAAMDRDFLDLRFRLRGQVSKEQWAQIATGSGQ